MDFFWRAKSIWNYWRKAVSRHGVHSPFVFDFIHYVMAPMHFYVFDEFEELRGELIEDQRKLTMLDLGAGSKSGTGIERTVSEIAKVSVSPAITSQVLFRLVNHYGLKSQLELGTSLGLNALYLASSSTSVKLTTIEGSPVVAQIARENFKKFEVSNINLVEGEFSDSLARVLRQHESIDFAFVDGNHREKATWEYYESILEKSHPGTILVFDDIHWSPQMERVWNKIVRDSRNTLTIDWYRLGFVFFRQGIVKQHFVLKQRP